jgi:hypothetical protein
MNHTPGLWQVSPEDPRGCCVIAKGGPTIADVGPVVRGDWKANASLIAAAPELLEALRSCLSAMDMQEKRETEEFHIPQHSAWHIWSEAKTKADAAISRCEQDGS